LACGGRGAARGEEGQPGAGGRGGGGEKPKRTPWPRGRSVGAGRGALAVAGSWGLVTCRAPLDADVADVAPRLGYFASVSAGMVSVRGGDREDGSCSGKVPAGTIQELNRDTRSPVVWSRLGSGPLRALHVALAQPRERREGAGEHKKYPRGGQFFPCEADILRVWGPGGDVWAATATEGLPGAFS
jgi:hypothetical protein